MEGALSDEGLGAHKEIGGGGRDRGKRGVAVRQGGPIMSYDGQAPAW